MNSADAVTWLADQERTLWIAGLVLYGVGDTVTTLWGLSTPSIAEVGPVAAPLVEAHGRLALLGLKAGTLAVFYACWWLLAPPVRSAVPLALVVVGAVVTGWNLAAIAAAPP